MTAFTAVANMVREASYSDLKKDEEVKKMISDLDTLEEIESGEERATQRELLAQNIVTYLVQMDYITEEIGFNLLNLTNTDFNHPEIDDKDLDEVIEADPDYVNDDDVDDELLDPEDLDSED